MIQSFVLAAVLSFPSPAHDSGDLVPCQGVFSGADAPSPYRLALRSALVGEDRYRKCQLTAIPSFECEWGVYLLREESDTSRIVFKRMKKHLWGEMHQVLSAAGRNSTPSYGPEAEDRALKQLRIDAESYTVAISADTADLLEEVWWKMLGRVHYVEPESGGFDGETYFVSHWNPGSFRCGETWSPDDGTRTAALVQLAESMRDLTLVPLESRASSERALEKDARALLARLEPSKDLPR